MSVTAPRKWIPAMAVCIVFLGWTSGLAQMNCIEPECPEGFTFRDGTCRSGPDWKGAYAAHTPVECSEDRMLNPRTGLCCLPGGGDGGGQCREVECPEGFTFRDGTCRSGPDWKGAYAAHTPVECNEDEVFVPAAGLCCEVT